MINFFNKLHRYLGKFIEFICNHRNTFPYTYESGDIIFICLDCGKVNIEGKKND